MRRLRDSFSSVDSCFQALLIVALLLLSGQLGCVSFSSSPVYEIDSYSSTTITDVRTDEGGPLSIRDHSLIPTIIPSNQRFGCTCRKTSFS